MSYKYDPNVFNDRNILREEGKFIFTVTGEPEYSFTNTGILVAKITLEREGDGAVTTAKIFGKPEKSGNWTRLNQYIGSTSNQQELDALVARGAFDITDDFIKEVIERSVGRKLKGEVLKETYQKKDGTQGEAYSVVFFRPAR